MPPHRTPVSPPSSCHRVADRQAKLPQDPVQQARLQFAAAGRLMRDQIAALDPNMAALAAFSATSRRASSLSALTNPSRQGVALPAHRLRRPLFVGNRTFERERHLLYVGCTRRERLFVTH